MQSESNGGGGKKLHFKLLHILLIVAVPECYLNMLESPRKAVKL